jgi:hypothetical protein
MALFTCGEGSVNMHRVIEKKASEANSLDAFIHCNLPGIKDSVKNLLELIGRDGIFAEYSR